MEIDNSFEVPLPPAEAWKVLLDVERIVPCMPGAELSEVLGDNSYKGKISVKLGPVALTFAGTVKLDEINEAQRTARVMAKGIDAKGRGGATASSSFRIEPLDRGSKVLVHSNLMLSGAVAQYGRGVGIIQATATQIMNQFASSLKDRLAAEQVATVTPGAAAPSNTTSSNATISSVPTVTKPISGFSLMAGVFWSWLTGLFKR